MRAKVGRESERNGRESEREGRETFGEKAERQLGRRQSRSVFCLKFLILSKDLHILKSQRNILKTSHNIKMQMSGKRALLPCSKQEQREKIDHDRLLQKFRQCSFRELLLVQLHSISKQKT